ncbi:MAG: hypothetical protein JRF59_03625 [Deltaproteobacteria bacterium]|nr:hypothetical protein [Deltaproteobacteria bacterium]MBW1921848.1 hypothetical protein [Deltaproteobacteria bacterium]MBW1948011.1 hypothetical protein [Deltaproteobacteria bacterium]MBW2006954.1 hypothetical protein [Deltaproteobacteria bacterium]MBW2103645.1 hypothetical protein [Deltaproteobacteria bacterium]
MARDCCWNCRYYVARGDNEPALLAGALSNVCTFDEHEDEEGNWAERACPTPPGYLCRNYRERFY